jgi:hypothetical protein
VQLPFLQRTIHQFDLFPVVFGRAEPAEVAAALAPWVTDKTLVVASSDLSHYEPYAEARRLDREFLQWICETNLTALQQPASESRACGRLPILTLLHLARLKGWTPRLLDYRNSGDTAGDRRRVVGYGAVAFTDETVAVRATQTGGAAAGRAALGADERRFLLDLARETVTRVTTGKPPPEVAPESVPFGCRMARGCFVTLTKAGSLRGCIGNILPAGPLSQAVVEDSRSAALRDPRFSPVRAEEVPALEIEISVLSLPEPLAFATPDELLARLRPRQDGVVLRIGDRAATFLPQVWDQLPDKAEFLDHLSLKAGCAPSAWRGEGVAVSIYQVEAFNDAH